MPRTTWFASSLAIQDEPLILSLLKYRLLKDRQPSVAYKNLVSSKTEAGTHMPILDIDIPHLVEESSTEGHSHLYLDVEMSHWRWVALMIGLRISRVIEPGFFIWSMRRGQNFVRLPEVRKRGEDEWTKPTYGWFFKLKQR